MTPTGGAIRDSSSITAYRACRRRWLVRCLHHTMRTVHAKVVWPVLGAILLVGCETLPELTRSEREAAWRAHAAALSRFQTWTLVGNVVVRSDDGASRVLMQWRQTRDAYRIRFTAFPSAGLFEIEGSASGVEVRFADGRRIRGASSQTLIEREIGWSVPLEGLRYWIIGGIAPGLASAQFELDDRGRLAHLEQAGWAVAYERYGEVGDLALPDRMRLSRGSVAAVVVIRRWQGEG